MTAQPNWSPVDEQTDRCGTYAGYQAHYRAGTPRCAACREANREYGAARRAASEEARIYDSLYAGARSRAMTRLAALHPGQYAALIAEEMDR